MKKAKHNNEKAEVVLKRFTKKIAILVGIVWIIGIIIPIAIYFFEEYTSHSKTNFKSYEAFREITHDYYPDKKPESAHSIKYYYFEGKFDEFSAVSFYVGQDDYDELRQYYIEYFKEYNNYSGEGYVRYENYEFNPDFIQEESLTFLEEMMDEEYCGFEIIEYMASENSEKKSILGVFGNAKTGQIVIFCGKDAFPEQ